MSTAAVGWSTFHDFACLEFHRRARRNHKAAAGLIGVATDPRLRQPDLQYTEVPQFHRLTLCQRIGNVVESPLHHLENIVLHQARFVRNLYHQLPFG